jgi:hypothetical protein
VRVVGLGRANLNQELDGCTEVFPSYSMELFCLDVGPRGWRGTVRMLASTCLEVVVILDLRYAALMICTRGFAA